MKHNGFNKVWHIEGGIIEYARKAREQGLPVRFIGKNFVFDERMGERISDEIIAHCHQCGAPCDSHTNCKNDGCHLLFSSVQYVRKNTKVVVVRFAAKKARYRQKNSDAVGQDVKMGSDLNKSRGRLNTTLGIPDPTE
ncbi:hypothetical protein ACLK11_06075 [Escherichia coli]